MRHLIYPLHTILDDSIGCAIWFAARGRGLVTNETGDRVEYVSTARVRIKPTMASVDYYVQ